jgi:hypothetical protein
MNCICGKILNISMMKQTQIASSVKQRDGKRNKICRVGLIFILPIVMGERNSNFGFLI